MALPPEKQEKLKEQIGEEVYKSWKEKVKDLVDHEVDAKTAKEVVVGGIQKAAKRWNKEDPVGWNGV